MKDQFFKFLFSGFAISLASVVFPDGETDAFLSEDYQPKQEIAAARQDYPMASMDESNYNDDQMQPQMQKPVEQDLFRKNERVSFASVEFLWWRIEEDATDYAVRMTQADPAGGGNVFPQGKYRRAKFNWDPGYRVTLGTFNAPNFWELYAQYSWIYIKGFTSSSIPNAADRFINPTQVLLSLTPGVTLQRAEVKIGIQFHMGDIMFARVFFPNPHLRLRLLGGFSGGWMKQNWRPRYYNILTEIERVRNMWTFYGAGLKVGGTVDWYWGAGFYLTGRWATALVLGRYHNKFVQKVLTSPDLIRNTKYKDYRPALTGQFQIGPSFQVNFTKGRFELFGGYELTPWWNLQENYRTTLDPDLPLVTHNRSVILFHGATARATLDF